MSKVLITRGCEHVADFDTKAKYIEAYKETAVAVNYIEGTRIENMPTVIIRSRKEIDALKDDCDVKGKVYAILVTSTDDSVMKWGKCETYEEYVRLFSQVYICFLMEA